MSDDLKGPWKWQLLEALSRIEQNLEKLTSQSETSRKLSEAGKKSAAARKLKFGSSNPKAVRVNPVIQFSVGPELKELLQTMPPGQISIIEEPVVEGVRASRVKKLKVPSNGSLVWERYEQAYRERWKTDPLRNAQANKNCSQLAALVGGERAIRLVAYYVGRCDAFYINSKHPLGICLLHAQKLVTEMETGSVMVMTDARRAESASQTERAIQQYMSSQKREPVHEQVRTDKVENADR